jgi:hypothetical protein
MPPPSYRPRGRSCIILRAAFIRVREYPVLAVALYYFVLGTTILGERAPLRSSPSLAPSLARITVWNSASNAAVVVST